MSLIKSLACAAFALALAAPGAAAQVERRARDRDAQIDSLLRELRETTRELRELGAVEGLREFRLEEPGRLLTMASAGRRARLGVTVDAEADPATDSIGARIESVVPDGPADKAGIKSGDVITKFNGKSLLQDGRDYDEDESAPGMRLIEWARKTEPGDTVTLEYRRGKETRTAKVVAGDIEPPLARARVLGAGGPLELRERVLRGPRSFAFMFGDAVGGLELVSLNKDLGDYFGATEGVLVVKAPEKDGLSLKAGDVIQSIGGRKVTSPEQALRILRSYEPGEKVSFEIVRQKKKMTVDGNAPEGWGRVFEHRPDEEP